MDANFYVSIDAIIGAEILLGGEKRPPPVYTHDCKMPITLGVEKLDVKYDVGAKCEGVDSSLRGAGIEMKLIKLSKWC